MGLPTRSDFVDDPSQIEQQQQLNRTRTALYSESAIVTAFPQARLYGQRSQYQSGVKEASRASRPPVRGAEHAQEFRRQFRVKWLNTRDSSFVPPAYGSNSSTFLESGNNATKVAV